MSPSLNHCLPSRRQRTMKAKSSKATRATCPSSNTHASASFSAFSAKVTLCLAASIDRSLPRPLRPAWVPVLAAGPDPTLPRRCWTWPVESTSELPVDLRRKNPPIREVLVDDPLLLGAVVPVSEVVVAALSVLRDEEKRAPRLRGVLREGKVS